MIPSGYKEDVVYSQIPTDGSGDLSFTRASNGTRINSAGLVEVTPWNLAQQSEDLTNGVWTTTSTTITADNTTAPNGTATADKVEISSSTNARVQQIINSNSITSGLPCTFSVYIKSVSGTGNVGIRSGQTGLSSVFSYTNQWQRFEWTFNAYALSEIMQFCNNTLVGGADSAPSFYAWGCQLNIGSTAKPYFPTTDRLNVPRLTYQNGGGGCPSLLLEKQSTNLVQYSEQFDVPSASGGWSQSGVTITANTIISPDGTQNADTLYSNVSTYVAVYETITTTNGATYTASVYAKKGNQNFLGLELRGAGSSPDAIFNLNTGVVVSGTGTIENVGNGWYRCSITIVANSTSSLFIIGRGSSGAVGDTVYIWGAQLEASSYPTSYIPTTSSSATRVADACFKTGITSLIGQTSGTMFVDFIAKGSYDSNNLLMLISAGSGSNIIYLNLVGGTIEAYIASSAIQQFLYTGATALGANTRHKLAIGYANNDVVLYHNGTQLATDTSATIPACSVIRIGDFLGGIYQFGNSINQSILFPTRLTNAELASLTTI
jgi:hypothetical protein